MELYREVLVDKGVYSVTGSLQVAVDVVHIVKNAIREQSFVNTLLTSECSVFQNPLHALVLEFPQINALDVGWLNTAGQHLYADYSTRYGVFDSAVGPNVTFYKYDRVSGAPTTIRNGGDLVKFNLTARPWWTAGVEASSGTAWLVFNPLVVTSGIVETVLLRIDLPSPMIGVVMLSISLAQLNTFFSTFNLTTHGEAFVADEPSLWLLAATPGIPTTLNNSRVTALTCPVTSVVTATQTWLARNNGNHNESHFAVDSLYVDVVPIRMEGDLTWWLFVLTPSEDFFGGLKEKQEHVLAASSHSLWGVLSAEAFCCASAILGAVVIAVLIARTLTRVTQKLHKVSEGHFSRSTTGSDFSINFFSEIQNVRGSTKRYRQCSQHSIRSASMCPHKSSTICAKTD
eukprot:TRINITY_DN1146_c0_g1_i3.p1 TRINITY_DN1146_c0_g1~~TRINITY_DN1146_c0_g1_i3.p1  ORF type:complete len:401 (+),score=45.69 TRINITY_DN1146_c0_g1_i3:390-1592(+)